MNALKALYLFLNQHMKVVAIIWACALLPVALIPAFGWVVIALIAALCILTFVGDYPAGWIQEVEVE